MMPGWLGWVPEWLWATFPVYVFIVGFAWWLFRVEV